MKLYKKLFDIEEINRNMSGSSVNAARIITKQLKENWNLYKELYEYDTDIVADLLVRELNGDLTELKRISYKDFRKIYKNYDDYVTATCFYKELYFSANNVWENNKIW